VLALYEENLEFSYGIIWEDEKYYPKISIIYDRARPNLKSKKEQLSLLIKLVYKKMYTHRKIYRVIKKFGGSDWLQNCWVEESGTLSVLNGKGYASYWIAIVIEAFNLLDQKLKELNPEETKEFRESFGGEAINYDDFPEAVKREIDAHSEYCPEQ
jgi:hypothetical protein